MIPDKRILFTAILAAATGAPAAEAVRARVLLDDVIPPASPIEVRLICDGRMVEETIAGPGGYFQFQKSGANSKCRVTGRADGYEAASVSVARLPRDPDIGGLVLQRAGRANGYALSVTSLVAAARARERFAAAVAALREGGQQGMARAEAGFAEAAGEDPSFAEAWYQLGRLRLARQDAEGGRDAFRKAIAADPWYANPYRPLLLLAFGNEKWEEAAELCERLLEINPYLADIRHQRGVALAKLGRVEAAKAGTASGPRDRQGKAAGGAPVPPIDFRMAGTEIESAIARQDWPQAEETLFGLAKERPAPAPLLRALAAAHLKNGRFLQCAVAYLRAHRLAPLDAASRYALATAYMGLEKRNWARRELEHLARSEPRNPLYPLTLAVVFHDLQWFGESREQALRALRLDPESRPAYQRLGLALKGMNQLDEALAAFRKAGADFHTGQLLNELGKPAEASEALERALASDPASSAASYELGKALGKLGRWPAAIAALERAARLAPDEARIHHALSQAYRRTGETGKAGAALRRFRALSGGQ